MAFHTQQVAELVSRSIKLYDLGAISKVQLEARLFKLHQIEQL